MTRGVMTRRVLWGVAVAALAAAYVLGATRQARLVNTTLENTDQGSYLEYAVNMRETGYEYVGGRNQMPVYPFLLSLLYNPSRSLDEAFERGKAFNIALSVGLLGVLFVVWRRRFPTLQTVALLLVTAFGVFLFKAGYIQTELLYYVMAFVGFLLMARLLESPRWPLAAATGVYLGIVHLTKASVLPGLALFAMLGLARAAWLGWRGRAEGATARASALRQAGVVALVVVGFLLTISPYLLTSKRVFGHAFYNVNSTFYMWYETWPEAMRGTIAHGDRVGWPELPADSLPSAARYLREHGVGDIVKRVYAGLDVLFGTAVQSYGYWKYVLFYGLLALIVALAWPGRTAAALRERPFVALFAAGYLVGYLLLYAWYVPVAAGNRLLLAIFLPFLAVAGAVIARQGVETAPDGTSRPAAWFLVAHAIMIAALLAELPDILLRRVATVYGGG
jgi:hypothetical protein